MALTPTTPPLHSTFLSSVGFGVWKRRVIWGGDELLLITMKLIRAGSHEEASVSKTIRALLVIGNVCYVIVKLLTYFTCSNDVFIA